MKTLTAIITSSVSADGFEVVVNDADKTLFTDRYSYGYNASYSKRHVTNDKPYVTDILLDLVNKYGIEKLIVKNGITRHTGRNLNRVNGFKANHIYTSETLTDLL